MNFVAGSIWCWIKKSSIKPNITHYERKALKQLRENTELTIRRADKGGGIVLLNTLDYDNKMDDILNSGEYISLNKNPTSQIERKVYKVLVKYKEVIPAKIRTLLTPHYSKVPHIYGLPKVHKENIPLRPIVSSRFGPVYELSKFLLPIISPLSESCNYIVKDSKHFVNTISNLVMDKNDIMVSFDVVNLFPSVPIVSTLDIVKERLEGDPSLSGRTNLPVVGIMELLGVCLNSVYFQYKEKFFSQRDGLPMGSSLSPALANIYMDWLERKLFSESVVKPKLWLRFVDDTFVIWQHGREKLETFFEVLNNLTPSIKFTFELESNNSLPFLDVLVNRNNGVINTTVYRKPTHTGQYINAGSNHADHVKRGVIRTLHSRAQAICSNEDDFKKEMGKIVSDFSKNGYSRRYVNKTLTSRRGTRNVNNEEVRGSLVIPYIRGTSEKIRRIAKKYGVRTAFHSRNTIGKLLSNTRPTTPKLLSKNVIYSLPCECGARYFGETLRPLEVRLAEHRKNVKEGKTNVSKLAEHVWNKQHKILWDSVDIVGRETNSSKRKIIEASFMAVNEDCISQASKEVSKIWLKSIREYVGSGAR